jgi:hypothetical protein
MGIEGQLEHVRGVDPTRDSRNAEQDVAAENRARNGREARAHCEMNLGRRHQVDERLDKARALALADEGRSSSDDSWIERGIRGKVSTRDRLQSQAGGSAPSAPEMFIV